MWALQRPEDSCNLDLEFGGLWLARLYFAGQVLRDFRVSGQLQGQFFAGSTGTCLCKTELREGWG